MMNGVWFDDVHSYNDLNLVLSQVNIPPAPAKTNYVDIPGSDGSVDLTEALGEVKYGDREDCSFVFTVFPYDDFEVKKQQVNNLLNGQRCKITVDKDPEYYWIGRCAVSEYESDRNLHKITVTAIVAPYKLKHSPTVVSVPAGIRVQVNIVNGRKTTVPTITCTAATTIVRGDDTFSFNAGTHKDLELALKEGTTSLIITSTAAVTITYQEGDL